MGSTPLFGLQPVLLSSNLASVVRKSTQATVQCWGVGQRDRPELICCQQTSHATPLGYMVNWGECIVLVYTEYYPCHCMQCSKQCCSVATNQLTPNYSQPFIGKLETTAFFSMQHQAGQFLWPKNCWIFQVLQVMFWISSLKHHNIGIKTKNKQKEMARF